MSDCRFGVSPVNYPDPDPDLHTQRNGRVGYGRAGQGGVWQDRSKVGVGCGGGRVR